MKSHLFELEQWIMNNYIHFFSIILIDDNKWKRFIRGKNSLMVEVEKDWNWITTTKKHWRFLNFIFTNSDFSLFCSSLVLQWPHHAELLTATLTTPEVSYLQVSQWLFLDLKCPSTPRCSLNSLWVIMSMLKAPVSHQSYRILEKSLL